MTPILTELEIEAQAAELEARIESRIDAALTPDVLSRLAFKGITPAQAREYLGRKVVLALVEEANR